MAAIVELAPHTDPRLVAAPSAAETLQLVIPAAGSPAAAAAHAFVERHDGHWTFRADAASGRLVAVLGSGIALSEIGVDSSDDPALLGLAIRTWLDGEADWLRPPAGELTLGEDRSLARDDGRLISLRYDWIVAGIPVEDAGLFVGINRGRITSLTARLLDGNAPTTSPRIDAASARRLALIYSGDGEATRVESPRLILVPEDGPSGRWLRLVWRMRHVAPGRVETWETRIDATSGKVIGFRDINRYGRVVGGVYPNSIAGFNEVRVPLPGVAVDIDGSRRVTDSAGRYGYTGGHSMTGLDGAYIDTNCVDCVNPIQPFRQTRVGTGRLDLGLAGVDAVGNGRSTAADRNAHYHMTQARRVVAQWLPGLRWLGRTRFRAHVNIPLECNAFFDGHSVNFYRSGGGCHNSGLIRDVIQHEWGHGLDQATQGADGGAGEATADVTALHLGRSAVLGPGFFIDGDPLRVLDASISPLGLLTRTRVNHGDCERPLGGISFHCEGQLFGQAAWELAQALIERHGHHTGWRLSERLFFQSLPDAGPLYPERPMSMYEAYLKADDDDGDLANGTPHAAEIHAAFDRHEIAGDALPVTPHCARPAQPEATVTVLCDGFELSWPPVEGAARYRVLRSELRADSAFFPVARVPAGQPRYVDKAVAPALDYTYVVMAVDASGCESTVEDPLPARLADRAEVSVLSVDVTDAPRGNRSGFADPGEEVDLRLVLSNDGTMEANGASGTLRSLTPGVEVGIPITSWPAIPAGQSGPAEGNLRLTTDAGRLACGDAIRMVFEPEDIDGCRGDASYFSIRIGETVGRGAYVCDPAPACFTQPTFDGLEQAVAGGSCGETLLTWQAAQTHCVDATITYDVYRSTDADFMPGPGTLIAERYPGTTYHDLHLEPGVEYHYIVRAYDSRAAEEDNAVVRSVVAPIRPDTTAPQFGGLASATTGEACGETRLAWPDADESCSLPVVYDVYRSTDPSFEPAPENRIGSTDAREFVDFAPEPGRDYAYVVRARDAAGNVDDNAIARVTEARNFDRVMIHADFEDSGERWEVVEPNDATRGNWEWGDPEGSEIQSEHDASPFGVNAWITGLLRWLPDGNNNDVDQGTTTLLSFKYDLSEAVDPVVRYMRWFTNDRFQNPGDPEDNFLVHASNDDGATWKLIEEVGAGTPLEWVPVDIPLAGLLRPTEAMRFRFTAADPGFSVLNASGVEAGIDEFILVDRGRGCVSCSDKHRPVEGLQVESVGRDLELSWNAAAAPGRRYLVERLVGKARRPLRVGSTAASRFVVVDGAATVSDHSYRVVEIGACGPPSGSAR